MNATTSLYLAALACASFLLAACGGSVSSGGTGGSGGGTGTGGSAGSGGGTGTGGAYDVCATAADCAWGEIEHEILQASDCVCLYGCPYIPLSKETVDRRNMQYQALCTPGQDGNGNPCGVDDCAVPPPIQCMSGKCVAPPP
jgi:hypothetical protein